MAEDRLFAPTFGLAPALSLGVDRSVHRSKAEDQASEYHQLLQDRLSLSAAIN